MAQLPSANLPSLWLRFSAFLRSSHAVVVIFGLICLLFAIWVPDLRIPAFVLFAIVALLIVGRYVLRGPETERAQPTVSITHFEARIVNFDPAFMNTPEFRALLRALIQFRRPLPAPTGVLQGPSSNQASIREVPPEEAERLRIQDNA